MTDNTKLPPELVSLVHHIELNKAGWWDKAIQQLIVAGIWLTGETLTLEGIADTISRTFSVRLDTSKVNKQLDFLRQAGTVVAIKNGEFKIAERSLKEFEMSVREAEEIEKKAEKKFGEALNNCCPDLEAGKTWNTLNDQLLVPLIGEMGARTYEMVSGARLEFESRATFREFLEGYPDEVRQDLRNAVIRFLDPKDGDVRTYILRQLNAYFFVEAGNLSEATIDALSATDASAPSFTLFVDTNFLFSILGLHENPSNEAAQALMELASNVAGKAELKFIVSPLTVDETRRVLEATAENLRYVRLSPNMAEAALQHGLSGLDLKFVEESRKAGHALTAEDYFGPYITDLAGILRAAGVDVLSEDVDHYTTKSEVVDDLNDQLEFEARRVVERPKGYNAILHDMVLWHIVSDRRPATVESPSEADCWIVTLDFRFLGFDRHKSGSRIPICVHPAPLMQMLQFWVPRTKEFEEAILGNLRLPFLFQDFDPSAEQVTMRILQTLSRFENVGDLSRETVTSILKNDALRQKLANEKDIDRETELVREALIEGYGRIAAELKTAQTTAEDLGQQARERGEAVAELNRQIKESREALGRSEARRTEELRKSEQRAKDLESELKQKEEEEEKNRALREFALKWVALPVALISLTALGASVLTRNLTDWGAWRPGLGAGSVLLFVWFWMAEHQGSRSPAVSAWRAFDLVRRFRAWVLTAAGSAVVGLAVIYIYEWINGG